MKPILHLLPLLLLTWCVLGSPSTQLTHNQSAEKLEVDNEVLDSIKEIIEEEVHSSVVNAYLGLFPEVAASSCKEIAEEKGDYKSDYYWIKSSAGPVGVYCNMKLRKSGGWMRVANVDMRDSDGQCPEGIFINNTNKRTCERGERFDTETGCASVFFPVHSVPYKKVSGRIIGYQSGRPNGFAVSYRFPDIGINDTYVDGVSLTHGQPRNHIWTYAEANPVLPHHTGVFTCPCLEYTTPFLGVIPSFVGDDYYCATGASDYDDHWVNPKDLYTEDPLWDGKGCDGNNICCNRGEPWFYKELSYSTTDSIELRLCLNNPRTKEDLKLEQIELYVQ